MQKLLRRKGVLELYQVETAEQTRLAETLLREYIESLNPLFAVELNSTMDVDLVTAHDMAEIARYRPPRGRLLIAEYGGETAGMAWLRQIGKGVAEVKRMYVRPGFRGKGIGRALLQALISAAKQEGYSCVRLDSGLFMREAVALYRSLGFVEIEPYAGSSIPAEFWPRCIFMELPLE